MTTTLCQYANDFYATGAPAAYGPLTMLGLMLVLLTGFIGMVVHQRMQASMRRYSSEPAPLTGAQAAERMLRDYGVSGVRITSTRGSLTDHYNPVNRTVNLSETVYGHATVAAVAVAAHECGHAIQHAQAYAWLTLRSELVPLVSIGSHLGQIVLFVGLLLAMMGGSTTVAWVGLALFATTTVFALVTLPVEFDASRRALAWLESSGLASRAMHGQAGSALRWAAMTYVAAALSSIAMLLYYALMLLGRSNRNEE